MMDKLAVVFVALVVTAVAAAPNNLLTNFKSPKQMKKATSLMRPPQTIEQQRRVSDGIRLTMRVLDINHDGMLDVDELNLVVSMSGASKHEMDTFLRSLMSFDKDKNQKLDINELAAAGRILGF